MLDFDNSFRYALRKSPESARDLTFVSVKDRVSKNKVQFIVNPYLTKLNWLATNSPVSYTPTHKSP